MFIVSLLSVVDNIFGIFIGAGKVILALDCPAFESIANYKLLVASKDIIVLILAAEAVSLSNNS